MAREHPTWYDGFHPILTYRKAMLEARLSAVAALWRLEPSGPRRWISKASG